MNGARERRILTHRFGRSEGDGRLFLGEWHFIVCRMTFHLNGNSATERNKINAFKTEHARRRKNSEEILLKLHRLLINWIFKILFHIFLTSQTARNCEHFSIPRFDRRFRNYIIFWKSFCAVKLNVCPSPHRSDRPAMHPPIRF